MDSSTAICGLSALAHPGRLDIYRLLVKAGSSGVAAGDIARSLAVLPNSLSPNLNVLKHAGLIDGRRTGRSIIYTARYDRMRELMAFLLEDCCVGSPEICEGVAESLDRVLCCS